MADETKVKLPFSPSGAGSVEIEWIVPDAGRFGRDRSVPRRDATHARITELGGSKPGSRTVIASEADALIREVGQLAAEYQSVQDAADARWNDWVASLRSECPRCSVARVYEGTRRIQTGGVGAELLIGTIAVTNLDLHVYVCRHCGSVELFANSEVSHPLAGNSPETGKDRPRR